MTRAAKKIADYILANYQETKYLSISSLAEKINVSESMITKFVRILGREGVPGLQGAARHEPGQQRARR